MTRKLDPEMKLTAAQVDQVRRRYTNLARVLRDTFLEATLKELEHATKVSEVQAVIDRCTAYIRGSTRAKGSRLKLRAQRKMP